MWWGNKTQSHTHCPLTYILHLSMHNCMYGVTPLERSAGECHTNYSGWDTATLGLASSATAYAALKVTGVAVGSVLSVSLAINNHTCNNHEIWLHGNTSHFGQHKKSQGEFSNEILDQQFLFCFLDLFFLRTTCFVKASCLKYCWSGMNWILTGVLSRKTSSKLLTMSWKYRHHYLPL